MADFHRIHRQTPEEFRDDQMKTLSDSERKNIHVEKIRKEDEKREERYQRNHTYWGAYDRMVEFGFSDEEALAEAEQYRGNSS